MLEKEQDTISQMYDLITAYAVPYPPEDVVAFASLQPSINSLHDIIHETVAEREAYMEKFCTSLHDDVLKLNQRIMQVKLKSQVREKLFCKMNKQVIIIENW